jgi:sulfate adenylyltransferase subunit 1 (EFTu-like GTPase family)
MNATQFEGTSTALFKFDLGSAPGRIPLPPGRVVVAVDGMERAGFEYAAFKAERNAFLALNPPPRGTDLTFVPVSSHYGDMILRRGDHIDWYDGPTLAEALGI